ncbi:MAG TPA: hemerythrin domain-containing protein [Caldimonas sp.]
MVQSRVSSKVASPVPANARRVSGFATLDACHRRALARVAELGALVAAIEASEITSAMRASAAAIAQFLGTEARRHHEDEERHIFPPLLAGGDARLVQTVLRLQQDHGWLEEDWLELEPHVQAIATGYGTCDVDTLREGTSILAALYEEHIALEESIAYPEARKRIRQAGLDGMAREMLGRRRIERRHPSGG